MSKIIDSQIFSKIAAGTISVSLFLLMWYWGTHGTALGQLLPEPQIVFRQFIESCFKPIGKYTIPGHALWSLSRVMIGFVVGSAVGIALGLAMGWYRVAEAIFKPLYEVIRPIPPIAWIPIAIIWLGLGEEAKYFLIFLSAFANTTLNSYAGAKAVDPVIVGAAKMLGANDRQLFATIVLPSSVPYIFAGLQVAISVCWATVLAAEMVRSSEGVGWMIVSGMEMNNTTQILTGIIAIGLIGFVLATIMRVIEDRLCVWNKQGT